MTALLERQLRLAGADLSRVGELSADACVIHPECLRDTSRPAVALDPGAPDRQCFILLRDHEWLGELDGDRLRIWTRAGTRWDGASIPRLVRVLFDRVELGALGSMCHDGFYRGGGRYTFGESSRVLTRPPADRLFGIQMEEDGVVEWKRRLAYRGVRLGGASSWRIVT